MREYLTVFLVAATTTYLLGVFAREVALRTGAVAKVRDRDVHAVPIPYFGGVAMLGGLTAAYLVGARLPFLSQESHGSVFRDAAVVLVAGAMVCLLGVVDDLIELDALTKLGGQLLVAGVLVYNDVYFYYFQLPGGGQLSPDPTQMQLLSVIIVVATINAVNFVDGLDGLASGVVGIGAVAFFLFSYTLAYVNDETRAITAALLCAALAGACAGFLPHNFFPARLFMGDSGSMLLAVIRRTRAGRSPFAPDKQHLHHRLLEIGHTQRRAVLIMYLWAGLIAFGGVLASLYAGAFTTYLLVVWVLVTVALTFVVPRLQRPSTRV